MYRLTVKIEAESCRKTLAVLKRTPKPAKQLIDPRTILDIQCRYSTTSGTGELSVCLNPSETLLRLGSATLTQ